MKDAATLDQNVESYVEAYEEALCADPHAHLCDFMPNRSDPMFPRIVTELIRVDLELSWGSGQKKSIDDYQHLLPELATNHELRAEVAYEEFRQRKHRGEQVTFEEFAEKYDIATGDWSTVIATVGGTKTTRTNFDEASRRIPTSGQPWRDFKILKEIGRGTLSRVLLARQTSLSSRFVVLKFAPKHVFEAEKLARLQHPNIVPVFSVYEDHDFHVFCMPYFGGRTLADLPARPIVATSALRFCAKLSDAIAHAHDRGILHNDIKPANILVSGTGEPMLLDFNLAADAVHARPTSVGGTLPYASPESLKGIANGVPISDERSDVFSLGAVLYELLANKQPFESTQEIPEAIEVRRQPLDVTGISRISPSHAAIVKKCLAFDPSDRYQSAVQLCEDLHRQLDHRPLRFAPNASSKEMAIKWCRRHPRICSVTSVAAACSLAAVLTLVAWFAREQHVNRLEASARHTVFQDSFQQLVPRLSAVGLDAVDVKSTIADAEALLAEYVDANKGWKQGNSYRYLDRSTQREVDRGISRLAFLTASGHAWLASRGKEQNAHLQSALHWNTLARDAAQQTRKSHLFQLARLLQMAGEPNAASVLVRAKEANAIDADDLQLVALLSRFDGDADSAIELIQAACEQSPQDFSKWFDLASAYAESGQWQKAEGCLTTCIALRPDSQLACYYRALVRYELGNYEGGIKDYSDFLQNTPSHPYGLLNRALAYLAARDFTSALEDLNKAIEQGFDRTRVLIIRSRVHRQLGDHRASSEDLRKALASTPQDDKGWVARGVARMEGSPKRALDDFHQALRLNPRNHAARRNIAYVLAERLNQTKEAIHCLDELIVKQPNDPGAYAGRGVLLARIGEFDRAIADARRVLELKSGPRQLFQAACIYSLASVERQKLQHTAIALLGSSLKVDPTLSQLAYSDADLRHLRALPSFKELCQAAETMATLPSTESLLQWAGGE